MNVNAANALLKSLEEPGTDTYFILASSRPARMPATVRSRCQSLDLPRPPRDVSLRWLGDIIEDEALAQKLMAMSDDCPLLARDWYEADWHEAISEMVVDLKKVLAKQASPIEQASKWQDPGLGQFVHWWWRWLMLELRRHIQQEGDKDSGLLVQFGLSMQALLDFMQGLSDANAQLQSTANPNEQLLAERLLIDWRELGGS
jgi:DNA polymerase-3 subunit delta'